MYTVGMNELEIQELTKFGISEKGAEIYLVSLSIGRASVQDLAKRTNMKRTSAYSHIKELLKLGFMEKVPMGKREYYQATDPSFLESRTEAQLKRIKTILPDLLARQASSSTAPRVKIVEGKQAMKQIYDEIANEKEVRYWSDMMSFEDNFKEMYSITGDLYKQYKIKAKEIIPDNAKSKSSAKRLDEASGGFHETRVAANGNLYNDTVLYGDVVVFFKMKDFSMTAIRIEDASIAESMRTVYDLAWEQATPLT